MAPPRESLWTRPLPWVAKYTGNGLLPAFREFHSLHLPALILAPLNVGQQLQHDNSLLPNNPSRIYFLVTSNSLRCFSKTFCRTLQSFTVELHVLGLEPADWNALLRTLARCLPPFYPFSQYVLESTSFSPGHLFVRLPPFQTPLSPKFLDPPTVFCDFFRISEIAASWVSGPPGLSTIFYFPYLQVMFPKKKWTKSSKSLSADTPSPPPVGLAFTPREHSLSPAPSFRKNFGPVPTRVGRGFLFFSYLLEVARH